MHSYEPVFESEWAAVYNKFPMEPMQFLALNLRPRQSIAPRLENVVLKEGMNIFFLEGIIIFKSKTQLFIPHDLRMKVTSHYFTFFFHSVN